MTAVSTNKARSLLSSSKDQYSNDLNLDRRVKAVRSTRMPDNDLVADCLDFSKSNSLRSKVIDLISIYKTALEMRDGLNSGRQVYLDQYIDEIEVALNLFLDTGTLVERQIKISEILK